MADRYKKRTLDWFREQGYLAEYAEKQYRIVKPGGQVLNVKRDLFSSDGISIGHGAVIFWNSVLGRNHVASHVRNYAKIPWPLCPQLKVWIVLWERGWRGPEVIDMAEVEVE